MHFRFVGWWSFVFGLYLAVAAMAQGPEKSFDLSPLQQQLEQAHDEWVVPSEKRPASKRHFIRLKRLSFDRSKDVRKQIEVYENENRRGFDAGPFEVRDTSGKTQEMSGWEVWYRDVFTIEKDWAEGLKTPYFCQVLQLRDSAGKPVEYERVSEEEYGELSRKAVRGMLRPLIASTDEELRQVPIYVVRYIGNFEGNAKYVKLYVGKPGTADFLVIDVSVYDHF